MNPSEQRTDGETLVDIREVSVDHDLPKEKRLAAFVEQIRKPYRFRCGEFIVNTSFNESGRSIEDCLQGILR